MRAVPPTAIAVLMVVQAGLSAPAHAAQVSPVRVEFTRPGGIPGAARAVVRPSEIYMIAPAQPDPANTVKRRKRR